MAKSLVKGDHSSEEWHGTTGALPNNPPAQVFLVKGDPASGNGAMASMSSMGSMDGGSMDGYVVVARLGSVLQELQLVTNLSRLAIKEVLSVAVKAV